MDWRNHKISRWETQNQGGRKGCLNGGGGSCTISHKKVVIVCIYFFQFPTAKKVEFLPPSQMLKTITATPIYKVNKICFHVLVTLHNIVCHEIGRHVPEDPATGG